jgi:T5SS/PEP-CTERM-associated repeat protein
MMSCRKTFSVLSLVTILCVSLVERVHGVTTNWNTDASGSFTASANWNNGVPDSEDTALFTRGLGAYTVTFPGGSVLDPPPSYLINRLIVRTNEVTFVDNSSPFVTSPILTVFNPDSSIVVGESAGEIAVLNTRLRGLYGANAVIGSAPGAKGMLNITAGTFGLSGKLDVGEAGTGTMNVTGGGRVESVSGNGIDTDTVIGSKVGSNGTVIVAGAGSTWTNTGGIVIGEFGTGKLIIQGAGNVSVAGATIGYNSGSNGSVVVTGTGSTWNNSYGLNVGQNGAGTITVEGGGSVISDVDSRVGLNPSASGTVIVTGAGSTWINGRDLAVGDEGPGILEISAGGAVSARDTYIGLQNIGPRLGTGTVTVDGSGSTWTNTRDLYVGGAGSGTLNITGGGRVSSVHGFVGHFSTTVATANIEGNGSIWSSSADLVIGDLGSATLTVSNGGTAAASDLLSIESKGVVKGNGNLSGNIINRGLVSPGTSIGALHLNSTYIQTALGKLQIELGGTVPGNSYDQLLVSGSISLNGTLQVDKVNSFEPSAGDAFDILDGGGISGTFSTIQLPLLTSGLVWDTSQLYTSGMLRVIGNLPGDYNQNGAIDAGDYVLWRNNLGSPVSLPNDDTAGVGQDDYNRWRGHFGQSAGGSGAMAGSLTSTAAGVPEPNSLDLVVLTIAHLILARRNWIRRVSHSTRRAAQRLPHVRPCRPRSVNLRLVHISNRTTNEYLRR